MSITVSLPGSRTSAPSGRGYQGTAGCGDFELAKANTYMLVDRQLTQGGVIQILSQRVKETGIKAKYMVHDLCYTFTKEAMRAGKSLASIQKQLGHASPDMVMSYAKVFRKDQRKDIIDFGDD